jgi:hypothetical protein
MGFRAPQPVTRLGDVLLLSFTRGVSSSENQRSNWLTWTSIHDRRLGGDLHADTARDAKFSSENGIDTVRDRRRDLIDHSDRISAPEPANAVGA